MYQQNPRNRMEDVMHKLQLAALHGPKGEDGIHFPSFMDEENGRVRAELTLSRFLDEHTRQENPIRLIRDN
jgi:hypothetical protein